MALRLAVTLILILNGLVFAQPPAAVSSPDGRLTLTFRTVSYPQAATEGALTANPQPAPNGGQLIYDVAFQGKALIEASALRLDLKDQAPLGPNLRIVNATTSATGPRTPPG